MTTLMQAVAGALWVLLLRHSLDATRLGMMLAVTAVALGASTLHLGRPAYAWRALKMWRRSWLSREVLLFTLFFLALTAATLCTLAAQLQHAPPASVITATDWTAAILGLLGTVASASIYLVPARPSWNMQHTPIDFVLTAAFLGALSAAALDELRAQLPVIATFRPFPCTLGWLTTCFAALSAGAWLVNQVVRFCRLRRSKVFELRASFSLLSSTLLRGRNIASFALVVISIAIATAGHPRLALACGFAGVLLARYLFFVSVVPLSMGLTFVRTRQA